MVLARDARHSRSADARRSRAQALLELALVMPVMVGLVAVLFQFGILFMSYQAVVHMTRDVGRWISVNPHTTDTAARAYVTTNVPSNIDDALLDVDFVPACVSLTNGVCTGRAVGSALEVRVTYDVRNNVYLPLQFRFGPWFNVSVPTTLPVYSYSVMVEPS